MKELRASKPPPHPPVDPVRVERQWANVAARLERRPARRSWRHVAVSLAAAFALAAALFVALKPAAKSSIAGTAVESAGGEQRIALPDGSIVILSPVNAAPDPLRGPATTRLRFEAFDERRVEATLERGQVRLDVAHVDGRVFVVHAGPFDVRVVGTLFEVSRQEGDGVEVMVERGRVEVVRRDHPSDVRALGAGERWSARNSEPQAAPSPRSPSASAAASSEPSVSPVPSSSPSDEPAPSGSAVVEAPRSWEALAKAKKFKEAYEVIGAEGFAPLVARSEPEKLFRLAEVARASGHLRDAERSFDALRRKHRGDARAGLAAYELGRLRMDSLGNPGGAVEALGDAIALAPSGPFREDAEARRVQALDGSGAGAACEVARDAYLARYPAGLHAAIVRTRCTRR